MALKSQILAGLHPDTSSKRRRKTVSPIQLFVWMLVNQISPELVPANKINAHAVATRAGVLKSREFPYSNTTKGSNWMRNEKYVVTNGAYSNPIVIDTAAARTDGTFAERR